MNKVMREMRRKIVWDLHCIDKEKYNVYVLAEIFSSSRQSILRDLSKMEDRFIERKMENLKDMITQQIQKNVENKRIEKLKADFQPSNGDKI